MIDKNKVYKNYRGFKVIAGWGTIKDSFHLLKVEDSTTLCSIPIEPSFRNEVVRLSVYINILDMCETCFDLMRQDCQLEG